MFNLFQPNELQQARQTAAKLLDLIDTEEKRQQEVNAAAQAVRNAFATLQGAVATLNQK